MAKHEYPPETKAAVMAALLTGQSVGSVARQYDLPKSTVMNWKGRASPIQPQKRDELGALISVFVKEGLQTAIEQYQFARKEDWLRKQGAESLAVFIGVTLDKVVRILEAGERARQLEGESDADSA